MYTDSYSDKITKELKKLKKKNFKQYKIIRGKMEWILENPDHRFKDLHYSMKGVKRIHLGHFILTFRIDHNKKFVSFEDYDHHDKIYKN